MSAALALALACSACAGHKPTLSERCDAYAQQSAANYLAPLPNQTKATFDSVAQSFARTCVLAGGPDAPGLQP